MAKNPFDPSDLEKALGGRYLLGDELRVGGQGVVYRATRVLDENGGGCKEDVAIKFHLDSRQDARVEREIAAVKNVRHQALAALLEDGVVRMGVRDVRYIAWEFIEGEALDTKISAGAMTERAVVQVAIDVVSAIAVLWSRRIVHRDISPKNIMVRPDGRAVLIDLGGARHLDNTTITAPGATFGTVGYLSPEQCRAEHALTSASDVFALGVVMLECLAGRHPTNFDQHRLMSSVLPVSTLVPNATRELRELIEGMVRLRAPFRPRIAQLQASFREFLGAR